MKLEARIEDGEGLPGAVHPAVRHREVVHDHQVLRPLPVHPLQDDDGLCGFAGAQESHRVVEPRAVAAGVAFQVAARAVGHVGLLGILAPGLGAVRILGAAEAPVGAPDEKRRHLVVRLQERARSRAVTAEA